MRALDLGGTQLDAERHHAVVCSQHLAEGLAGMLRLTALTLWRCELTRDTLRDLAPGLRCCTRLRHLDLNHNLFGDAGAEVLAGALWPLQALRSLEVMHTALTDAGARLLVAALSSEAAGAFRQTPAALAASAASPHTDLLVRTSQGGQEHQDAGAGAGGP